jgi:hypothetical protein
VSIKYVGPHVHRINRDYEAVAKVTRDDERMRGDHPAWEQRVKPILAIVEQLAGLGTRAVHDQPPPKAEDVSKPAVWPLVIVDMCERDRVGRARYGTPLQPNNGRDALKDAYQEALDLAAYLRQAIYERDGK